MTVDDSAVRGVTRRVHIRNVDVIIDDWYSLRRYTFDCSDCDGAGAPLSRYVCDRGDRAVVMPYRRSADTVLLIRQFRLPVLVAGHSDGVILEAPGGLLDGRSPKEAVRRELEEETGFRAQHVDEVLMTFLNPALVAERVHLFVADLDSAEQVGPGGGVNSEGESVDETVEVALDEALSLVRRRHIIDAKTILLLYWLQSRRSPSDARRATS